MFDNKYCGYIDGGGFKFSLGPNLANTDLFHHKTISSKDSRRNSHQNIAKDLKMLSVIFLKNQSIYNKLQYEQGTFHY